MTSDAIKTMQYDANKKSMLVAYLMAIFFGGLGIHRFYLGRKGSGLAMLLLTVIGIPAAIIFIGFIMIAVVQVWIIVDLFLIYGWVKIYNHQLITNL